MVEHRKVIEDAWNTFVAADLPPCPECSRIDYRWPADAALPVEVTGDREKFTAWLNEHKICAICHPRTEAQKSRARSLLAAVAKLKSYGDSPPCRKCGRREYVRERQNVKTGELEPCPPQCANCGRIHQGRFF